MRILVVYDSMYGNTARVASAIAGALRADGEVRVLAAAEATPAAMREAELLFVGSPTQRFRPLPTVGALLGRLPRRGLAGVPAAAFDTRIAVEEARSAVLSFFVRLQGTSAYAAGRIERALRRAGARPLVPGEGFFVDGTEGPLKDGELERAARWARGVATRVGVRLVDAAPEPARAGTRGAEGVGAAGAAGRGPRRPAPN